MVLKLLAKQQIIFTLSQVKNAVFLVLFFIYVIDIREDITILMVLVTVIGITTTDMLLLFHKTTIMKRMMFNLRTQKTYGTRYSWCLVWLIDLTWTIPQHSDMNYWRRKGYTMARRTVSFINPSSDIFHHFSRYIYSGRSSLWSYVRSYIICLRYDVHPLKWTRGFKLIFLKHPSRKEVLMLQHINKTYIYTFIII